jgi:peptidoglycan/xylan/chitin deacetylase (PgdA/CDA1 family)
MAPLLCGQGVILCMHHVKPADRNMTGFAPNSHLEITPEFLSEIIEFVRHRGYETLSLGDAVLRLKSPHVSAKPFVVFTLDDGYRDNKIFAQPVFDQLQCPFTVFVAPGIVEGTTELWWRALEQIISVSNKIELEIGGLSISRSAQTSVEKNLAWNHIYPKLRDTGEYEQRQIIRDLAKHHDLNLSKLCTDVAMNWDELRELAKDPLCTIGAHTIGHYLVAKLGAQDSQNEMRQSAQIIAGELKQDISFFAYPYGDQTAAGPRDFAIAEKLGFAASLTTRKGVVHQAHKDHLQALPRIMVSGRYADIRYIDMLLSGLPTAMANRFRKLHLN